jgi:hypothetical protein
VHAVVVCAPVNGNVVALWLNVDVVQLVVEWQMEQSCGKPAVMWFGTAPPSVAVLCQAGRWQLMQAVEAEVRL